MRSSRPPLRLAPLFLLAGLGLLAACGTPPAAAPQAAAGEAKSGTQEARRTTTSGSRLPGPAADRSVRTVGNAGAAEMVRQGQPNPMRSE